MKLKKLLSTTVTFTVVFLLTYAHADGLSKGILVSNAWVLACPPSQTTTAAYMDIVNNSSKEAVLVSASSDIADVTELHQMSEMNGMMKMVMIPNLQIPAQGKVTLQPGGFHIMLINLKRPVNKGDIVPITLHFQDGSAMLVNALVRPQQEKESSSMPGMKM
jgi:copper(I)-binding protein